jgi:hypothetical protein
MNPESPESEMKQLSRSINNKVGPKFHRYFYCKAVIVGDLPLKGS